MRLALRVFAGAWLACYAVSGAAQSLNINCGGEAITTTDGTQWAGDEYYTGGELLYTGAGIANTAVADYYLYRSARSGLYSDFSYSIPLTNGSYTVTLRFAEILDSAPGQRVFNVTLNGSTVLSNFDILAHVAPLTPYSQQFPVTVTGGSLQIGVVGVVGRGLLNAIQIAPVAAPAPALSVSTNALTFSGTAGGSNPAAQTVNISNTGGGTLNWTATSGQGWLGVSPGSGSGAGTLTIQPNLSGLTAGSYSGAVTVTAAGATGSPATVTVSLTVAAAPALSVGTNALTFSGTAGGSNPAAQTVNISNTGGGTLNWTATSGQGWLGVSPGSGSGAGTLTIQPNLSGLTAGSYSGAVTVTAAGATGSPATVTVSLTVAAAPALSVSTNALTFSGTAGGSNPAAQTVNISNTGGGTLNWTATSGQGWLGVSPGSGSGAGTLTIQPNLSGLTAGSYSGAVTVTAAGATGSPATVTVSLTVAAAPALSVGTNALTFSGTAGGSNPAAQTVNISNTGGGTLNWTASSGQGWLGVSPGSGSNAGTLTIQPNLSGLTAGSYSGAVTVTAAGAMGSPATVTVSLTVAAPPPSLSVSTNALTFSGTAGGSNPAAQTVNISNTGGGTLNWTTTSGQGWLGVSPGSGSGAGTLTIQPNLSGLTAGSYSGAVTVTAAGATGSPATVTVSLTVAAPAPSLSVTTNALTFSGTAGGSNPAAQTVNISNTGGGTLNWTATSGQGWLGVSPGSGSGAGTLTIQPNLSGLTAGSYSGAVTVTAAGATGSPATVTVSLTVAAPAPSLSVSTNALTFSGTAGGSNPAAQTVNISNTGGGTLNWTATSGQGWLGVSPGSGSGAGTLTIQPNLSGLTAGSYSGAVTVTAAGATGSPATVTVSLTVAAPAPSLSVSTNALTFSGTAGGSNPAAQTVNISNTGGGTLNWTATSGQGWLGVSPGSGSGAGTLTIQPNLSGLTAGSYSGAVTVTAAGATGSPATVTVSLTVAAPAPSLSVSTNALTFSGTAGGSNPAAQTVNISNTGGGTLNWTATSGQGWLGVSPGSGSGAGTLTIQPNLSGLTAGNYSGAVTVTAAGATGSPATVTVSLTVAADPPGTQVYINCGGITYTMANGTQWVGDEDFTSGEVLYTGSAIGNTQDGYLFGTARAGLYTDFSYSIPLANGSYTVTLLFAEIQDSAPGQRVFNVVLNGTTVLSNFDILTQVAPFTALTEQFNTSVTNGTLAINVVGVVGRGILNGIAVVPVSTAAPSLVLSGNTLSFSGTPGGGNPAAQSVSVTNGGGGTLSWTATSNASWLTVAPASGTNAGTLTVTAGVGSLAAGTYTGAVTVSAAGASGSPQTIAVSLTLAAPPQLTVTPTALSFSGTAGGANPATQTASIGNSGGGTLNWTVSADQPWVTLKPGSGTGPGSLLVQPTLTGLAAGTYTSNVTVSAPGAGGAPQTILVSLTVAAAPPSLTVSAPGTIAFSGTADGANPTSQTIGINNSGGGTLSWTATSSQGWLLISPTSGGAPASIALQPNLTGLTAGSYAATVTINAGNIAGSPVSVNVALTVSNGPPITVSCTGNCWYVSTSGTPSGDGSMANPWDIQTALYQPAAVKPGDTIWLLGGRYGGGQANSVIYSTLVGTPAEPIMVRAYPGQRATIDAWLQVGCCDQANDPANGSYTWFWGLEFAGYNTNRTAGTDGPPEWGYSYNHSAADTWGAGTKFINCIVHDTAGGISAWVAGNSELNGNIIYNVGGYATDRGHGHDLYLQNDAPATLTVMDNIGFNNFDEGVQAYGSSGAQVQDMTFTGNVVFNSGVLYGTLVDNFTIGGGTNGPDRITLTSNYTYDTPSLNQGQNELGYLWDPTAGAAVVTNNYFIGGYQAVDLEHWTSLNFQNNTMYVANGAQESWLIYTPTESPSAYTYKNNSYYGSDQFWLFPSCVGWPCANGYEALIGSQWQSLTGLDRNSTFSAGAPTGVWTFVRPNQYEPGRANIVVYNWPLNPSVTVDLSSAGIAVGATYQIRDAENWYNGAVVSGTYTGAAVTIPMTGLTVAQPNGTVPYPPSHTAPQFGVFVVLSGSALTNDF